MKTKKTKQKHYFNEITENKKYKTKYQSLYFICLNTIYSSLF